MNKKINGVLYIILLAVSVMLLIMTVIASVKGEKVFGGIMTVLSLAIFALATFVGIVFFNPGKPLRAVGFYLLHIGIIVFLSGQMIYMINGDKINVSVPVDDFSMYRKVNTTDGKSIDLGFSLGVSDFTEETYDDGSPKYYEAILNLDGEKSSLTVNHPIHYNGVKIYLMGFSKDSLGRTYAGLLLKWDSAEFVSTGGIIITLIGCFMMCLLRPKDIKSKPCDIKKISEGGESK